MKTWHIVAIAVGSVAAIAVVAKVVSAAPSRAPEFSGPIPGGPAGSSAPSGDAAERAVSGGFSLAERIVNAVSEDRARSAAARERELDRQAAREESGDDGAVTDPIVKSRLMNRGR